MQPSATRPTGRPTAPSLRDADNQTLVALCARGDQAAWARLVERYENLVFSVALRCGLNQDEADDVFQQVWIELYRSLARIRNPQGLPRWLIVSTRRLCYKHAARAARTVSGVSWEMMDPGALPDEEVESLETRRRLESALSRLDAPCPELLRLLFFGSRKTPYKTISRKTGLAVGSIGPMRSRCLKRLKAVLETIP